MNKHTVSNTGTINLRDGAAPVERAGAKAARLAELLSRGFRVPDGVVIPIEVTAGDGAAITDAVRSAIASLGDGPLAVRSSAVAEDQAGASYAGLYESVLGVSGVDDVEQAVRRVVASAIDPRVSAYDASAGGQIAVLIQHLVPADAAGVAFSANPLTGSRTEVQVTAVRGLGESLVSGESTGEEWTITANGATCVADPSVLSAADATRVADLARSVEALDGEPQDIEWAISGDELWLLQARPMTALPDEVSWAPPGLKGWWRRDFRLGEWLPEPVTPLFETWFLPTHEAAFARYCTEQFGMATAAPFNVVVNGWCFGGIGGVDAKLIAAMLRRPGYMVRSGIAIAKMFSDPVPLERLSARPSLERFRDDVLPRYRDRIAAAEAEIESASPTRLVELVDSICHSFGELMLPVVETLGFAYKSELALAAFHHRRLAGAVGGSHMTLVGGLVEPAAAPPHSVVSLDWVHPTLAESGRLGHPPTPEQHAALVAARLTAEGKSRAALADQPKQLRQFERILTITQEYAPVRQEIVSTMTLGWPVMRRAIARLGELTVERGAIADARDVHYLTRDELDRVISGSDTTDRSAMVSARRDSRQRQSRLVPPARVGPKKSNHERGEKRLGVVRSGQIDITAPGTIVGHPSSPGVATGPVRVITTMDQFARVQPGDILVAQITAPGWTPLFSIIAGVVTDGGSVAAHASIVAREYGIPAVVGTLDATTRLRDGDLVTVNGGQGVVVRVSSIP